jgi:hypothetical protein
MQVQHGPQHTFQSAEAYPKTLLNTNYEIILEKDKTWATKNSWHLFDTSPLKNLSWKFLKRRMRWMRHAVHESNTKNV